MHCHFFMGQRFRISVFRMGAEFSIKKGTDLFTPDRTPRHSTVSCHDCHVRIPFTQARTQRPMPDTEHRLTDAINALLPQTQCQRCEYQGCLPYAEAIANGDAINKCPPGGDRTIRRLAELLDVPVVPLDTRHGEPGPRMVALVRESECIGCTKCIQACPTDAIVGAARQMHTVLESECTGCELCIAPCPVDCIDMISPRQGNGTITEKQSRYWKKRHESRNMRLHLQQIERAQRRRNRLALQAHKSTAPTPTDANSTSGGLKFRSPEQIKAEIRAAVERTKARRAQQSRDRNR